jgi:uncharacterized protein (DUF1499 family)
LLIKNRIAELKSKLFKNKDDLEYVDLQDNQCIDKFNDSRKFDQMQSDLIQNCSRQLTTYRLTFDPLKLTLVEKIK